MGSATLTPIRKHNPAVSERVAAVIEKAMSVDISQRYQSADNFKQALLSSNTAALQRTQLSQKSAATTAATDPTTSLPVKEATSPGLPSTVSQPISSPVAKPALPIIPLLIGAFVLLGLVIVGVLLVFGGTFLLGSSQKPTTPAPPRLRWRLYLPPARLLQLPVRPQLQLLLLRPLPKQPSQLWPLLKLPPPHLPPQRLLWAEGQAKLHLHLPDLVYLKFGPWISAGRD